MIFPKTRMTYPVTTIQKGFTAITSKLNAYRMIPTRKKIADNQKVNCLGGVSLMPQCLPNEF